MSSQRTPRRPPRRHATGPPRPLYLPMRYVTFEEYHDIWPDENGSPYPYMNSEYPSKPSYWDDDKWSQIDHTACFYEWLILKNIEPKWFHQETTGIGKVRILTEYRDSWRDGSLMPPRRLWIKNYGGHKWIRTMSDYPKVNRAKVIFAILTTKLIDWLNNRTDTTDKPKRKYADEQMATLSELFEGYEGDEIKEKPEGSYGTIWK